MRFPTYADVGERAFGRAGRRAVSIVLYSELFCALVLFIILLGTNLVIALPRAGFTDVEFMCFSAAVRWLSSALCFLSVRVLLAPFFP